MSRRRRSGLDPDYRKAGWSQSKYAPKKSAMNMSQVGGLSAAVIWFCYQFGLPYLLPELRPAVGSFVGLAIGFLIFLLSWGAITASIRHREFKRLREVAGLRSEAELNAPEVLARRASAQVRAQSAGQFERDVAAVIRQLTRHEVVVTGGRGDGGVDIEIRSEKTLVGIVQCKQYDERTSLAPSHIRELAAVKAKRAVQIAYLVTTARFSKAAKTEAEELGVKLIDGAGLNKLRSRADRKVFGQTLD